MITIIGMTDDLLGWKKGLVQWQKPLLVIPAAIPLMVINAGNTFMELPFLGEINWGIIFPLLIIPLAIVCASNGFNILAGYNGLEAGMGTIILITLGAFAYQTGKIEVAVLALCMVGALLAFLKFNWFPAKVFPGDSLTYPVGALIACIAIIGDLQKIALILFIPYIIDLLLVLRSRCKGEAFAKVYDDGKLDSPYKKITHLTHFALVAIKKIKGTVYERDVVLFLCGIEFVMVIIVIFLYSGI
jgi:UDP-N-acetylglucosamine--dolichyl-phosphate N-acetylglucosaminephosphotransferase